MVKNSVQHSYLLPFIKGGLTKKEIAILVEQSIEKVLEKGNVFQVVEAVAVMENFIKGVRANDKFVDYLRQELVKHQGNFVTNAGAVIEICETAITYDYSNNANWKELDNEINELIDKRKALEDRLRKIPAGKIIVDYECGEMFTGPSKSSKSSYKITLMKQ